MARSPVVDVVLIGPRLAHNENLGLGFLVAALRRAGLHAVIAPLNSWVARDSVSATGRKLTSATERDPIRRDIPPAAPS